MILPLPSGAPKTFRRIGRIARRTVWKALTEAIAEDSSPEVHIQTPDRSVADTAFRNAMASVASTVFVIAARSEQDRVGRTVTAAVSLSASPPSVLVSLDTKSALMDAIRQTGSFSINGLAADQSKVADAFAGKLPPVFRFGVGLWTVWRSGNPKLSDGFLSGDCQVLGSVVVGSHTLVIGGLSEVETGDRSPLIWRSRAYAAAAPIQIAIPEPAQ